MPRTTRGDRELLGRLAFGTVTIFWAALVTSGGPAVAAEPAAAAWSDPLLVVPEAINIGGYAEVESVSCAAVANCTVGGFYREGGVNRPFLATQVEGVWGHPQTVSLPSAGSEGEVSVVSCVSPGNCLAGGSYSNGGYSRAFLVLQVNGLWGNATTAVPEELNSTGPEFVNSIDCPSVGNCVAVGSYRDNDGDQAFIRSLVGGVWGPVELPIPKALNLIGQAAVESVSCPSEDDCVATGYYGSERGVQAFLVAKVDGEWGPPELAITTASLSDNPSQSTSVSCSSIGNCAVGGWLIDGSLRHAFVVSQTDGVWGPTVLVVPATLNSGIAGVNSLSCPAAGHCVAGGHYRDDLGAQPFVAVQTDGVWGSPQLVVPSQSNSDPGQGASVASISCHSVGACVAGGHYRSSAAGQTAFLVSLEAGVLGSATLPVWQGDFAHRNDSVNAVSCPSSEFCAAGGYFRMGPSRLDDIQAFMATRTTLSGVASPPRDLAASPSLSAVNLSWSSPEFSNGGTISDYVIQYRSEPSGSWTTFADGVGTSTTAVVTGLAVDVPFEFRVAAVTATGTSAFSHAVTAVPSSGVTSAPQGLAVSAAVREATLSWSVPGALNGGTLTDYLVEYRVGSSGSWVTFADGVSTDTAATVTGLTSQTAYQFRVAAVTAFGTSPFASVSATTSALGSDRVAGSDRFATSAAISQQAFPTGEIGAGVPVVFVASGANFPDALSAGPVVSQLGGPVLLTAPTSLPEVVRAEIVRLQPERIVVIGGTGAISNAVFTQLQSLAPTERISGANRYETSRNVTRYGFEGSGAAVAYVAGGENFADALAAGAAAGSRNAPIVLVPGRASSVDAATLDLLQDLRVTRIIVVGGVGAISAGVESALSTVAPVDRLSGVDRIATARAVNVEAFDEADTVYLAYAFNFPDALGGGVLATVKPGPLFTVPGACVPSAVIAEIQRIGASKVVLLGGSGVLGSGVAALNPCG